MAMSQDQNGTEPTPMASADVQGDPVPIIMLHPKTIPSVNI